MIINTNKKDYLIVIAIYAITFVTSFYAVTNL